MNAKPTQGSAAAAAAPWDAQELLARARGLAPAIAARAERASAQRDLPAETIAELREAGLFRLFVPAKWGGDEANPCVFFEVQNIFAEVCASTAWVYGVLSVQSLIISLFDERAQEEVWGDGREALSCSSYQPSGIVTRVEDGFEISGRWTFSSGSTFADWAAVGGIAPAAGAASAPEMRLFLVPRADYELIDTWRSFGLRGTGSNDIEIKRAFVPAHRTLQPDMSLVPRQVAPCEAPSVYNLPWLYLFTSSISNLGVGIARGALKSFCASVRKSASLARGASAGNFNAIAAARAQAEITAVETMYRRHVARMMECASGQIMSLQEGLAMRVELSSALRRMAAIVDELNLLLGGRGVRLDSPLTCAWLDIMAARSHPGNDPTVSAAQLGELLINPQ